MRRSTVTGLAAVLAWCLSPGASEAADRVLSLDLCSDWLLTRYAQRARVAALSPFAARYPAPWAGPDWPTHDGTLEGILALVPDLVVTGEYSAPVLRRRLLALGTRVEVLPQPRHPDQVPDYVRRLLALLGLPPERAGRPPPPRPVRADAGRLLLLGANGVGTGRGTFEHDLLRAAGWRNYLDAPGYVALDLERIALDPPDAVVWAAPAGRALANRFARHPVLRHAVPAAHRHATDYWRWQCPGPWSRELVEELRQWNGD